jgi:lipoprotein-anchoring transpeptidase ErfK/SrfK
MLHLTRLNSAIRPLTTVSLVTLVLLACPCAAAAASGALASGEIATSAAIAKPSRAQGATLAGIVAPTPALSRPGGGRRLWWVSTQTVWSGEPQVLLVLGSARHAGQLWLRVLLPIRPDGTSGWIPRNNVVLKSTRYWIEVDKQTRLISVYRKGVLMRRLPAVIGKPATPTPDGLAAIYERDPQPDPSGFIGSWALPLTILSNVLYNFGGGPGRIAIHGRGGASLNDPLGSARSHGCIRIDNSSVAWLADHVQQGTPVLITG